MDPAALRPYALGILVGALSVAVVTNVAQFRAIDRQIGTTYASINRYPTPSPAEIVLEHTPTVRERFQLYAELSIWAPGADLYLAPRAGLQRDQLVGLGTIDTITEWDGDWDLSDPEADRIEAHVVAEGTDRWAGPFALAVIPTGVERVVSLRDADRLLLVDDRLLEGFDQ